MDEISRIKRVYAKRSLNGKSKLYTYFDKAALFMYHQRERDLLTCLKNNGIQNLLMQHILDVGCGGIVRDFLKYGASPENLFGIDLLPDRIRIAEKLSPHIGFRCIDASRLPFEDRSFDIVLQFTVFSSILEDQMKIDIAREMKRVLKPSGIIIWYDFYVNNPRNRNVRSIKKKEIHKLFSGCKIDLKRITLAPPLTRLIAPFSIILCHALEKIPFLCTHYIGIIRKIH